MLCNVLAAIDLRSVAQPWAESFFDEAAEEEKRMALRQMGKGVGTGADSAVASA
jgi:hypothetical protein